MTTYQKYHHSTGTLHNVKKDAKASFKFSIHDFSVEMNTKYSRLSLLMVVMFYIVTANTELERENIFEKITANFFPNLMKSLNPQIQEDRQILGKRKMNKTTPSHIILKLLKTSEKENLKDIQRKKTHDIQRNEEETIQSRTQWRNIFKVLKEKSLNKFKNIPVKCSLFTTELN